MSSAAAVISSLPIILISFYSLQPVSVYDTKCFGYFLNFPDQYFRLTSSLQHILPKAAFHSLVPSHNTQFPSVVITEACDLKCVSC